MAVQHPLKVSRVRSNRTSATTQIFFLSNKKGRSISPLPFSVPTIGLDLLLEVLLEPLECFLVVVLPCLGAESAVLATVLLVVGIDRLEYG